MNDINVTPIPEPVLPDHLTFYVLTGVFILCTLAFLGLVIYNMWHNPDFWDRRKRRR